MHYIGTKAAGGAGVNFNSDWSGDAYLKWPGGEVEIPAAALLDLARQIVARVLSEQVEQVIDEAGGWAAGGET